MRTLILNCDFDPSPETNGAQLLRSHLFAIGIGNVVTMNAFESVLPRKNKLKDFDNILITGSRASVYENERWIKKFAEILKAIKAAGIPTLGICFGFQMIAHFLGGKVVKSDSFEEGYTTIKLTEGGRKHFLFNGFPNEFKVYQSHEDIATELPQGSLVLAENINSLQAYAFDNFFCVQFHPEILPKAATRMAVRDKKNVKKMMNSVESDYSLTVKILSNFVKQEALKK